LGARSAGRPAATRAARRNGPGDPVTIV
jgi:hypothetical protein